MKKTILTGLFITITSFLFAQKIETVINAKETERVERSLASDDLRGRKAFSPEIDKAANFIAAEFKAAGLQTPDKGKGYRQEFSLVNPRQTSITVTFDDQAADTKKVIVITPKAGLHIDETAGYETAAIKPGSSFSLQAYGLIARKKNMIVLVDTSFTRYFNRLNSFKDGLFADDKTLVFILGTSLPSKFSIDVKNQLTEQKLANVVGILPGKSKKDEYVIFSGHYDHLGVGQAVAGDSIFNGANDDAAGTTAVILLAKYFKQLNNNERTLIFAAFTAEELGGIGSKYFSGQFDPAKVVAMFNIEMIGTESKWGKNSAYITGYEKTDMGTMLQRNLAGTDFTFYPDPYPQQQLFYRSDNATLALLGVPAHTISTSKMDNEPHYHKLSDQVETLDMDNMARIIQAIALSSKSIVAGNETPTRVNAEQLK